MSGYYKILIVFELFEKNAIANGRGVYGLSVRFQRLAERRTKVTAQPRSDSTNESAEK